MTSSAPSARSTCARSSRTAGRRASAARSGCAGSTRAALALRSRSTSSGRADVLPAIVAGVSVLSASRTQKPARALRPPGDDRAAERLQVRVSSSDDDRAEPADVLHDLALWRRARRAGRFAASPGGFHRLPSEAQPEEALEGTGCRKATPEERLTAAGIPNRRPSHGRLTRAAVPFASLPGSRRQC